MMAAVAGSGARRTMRAGVGGEAVRRWWRAGVSREEAAAMGVGGKDGFGCLFECQIFCHFSSIMDK